MKNILIIDDEREVLDMLRSVLRAKGFFVRCAEDGETGLELAAQDKPDLIILDLMMPRVSGLEVIKRLKRDQKLRTIPVLVISAVGNDKDRPDEYWARGLGVDDYLSKPFEPLDLLGRVEYIFRRDTYISTRNETEAPPEPLERPRRRPAQPEAVTRMSPTEVVKTYVEAWNNQDWDTEFACLSDELTGQLTRDDYIARRQTAFTEEMDKERTQRIREVLEEEDKGLTARVVIEREDSVSGRLWSRKGTYILKNTPTGWKIIRAREETMPRRPEKRIS